MAQKGQLGQRDTQTRGTPTLVKDLAGIDVISGEACMSPCCKLAGSIQALNNVGMPSLLSTKAGSCQILQQSMLAWLLMITVLLIRL